MPSNDTRPIPCRFCYDPARYVWLNHDPGVVDGTGGIAELQAEIGVCDTCQGLANNDMLVELVDRAVRRLVEKGSIRWGWSRNHLDGWQRRDVEALLAAWLSRRETFYVLSES